MISEVKNTAKQFELDFAVNVKLNDATMPPKADTCDVEIWINNTFD